MSRGRVTIRDIAERAGVSKSTVAYALRGDSQCSADTRERIQRVAKEMGYLANPLVSVHLANVRRSEAKSGYVATLAYLSDRPRKAMLAKGFTHQGAYEGALERAHELGYRLELFCYEDPDLSWDRLGQILRSRGIHGVVFGPHRAPSVKLAVDWDCFAMVLIGDSIAYPKCHWVGFDHLANMALLFGSLGQGEDLRVGLALSRFIDRRVRYQFRSAFELFQDERPEALRLPHYIPERWDREAFLKWYDAYRPDVVLTVYDEARSCLAAAGKKVPEDVGLLTPVIMADSLDHSGIYLSLHSLGRLAVDTVAAQLFRNERGIPKSPCASLMAGEWRQGVTWAGAAEARPTRRK